MRRALATLILVSAGAGAGPAYSAEPSFVELWRRCLTAISDGRPADTAGLAGPVETSIDASGGRARLRHWQVADLVMTEEEASLRGRFSRRCSVELRRGRTLGGKPFDAQLARLVAEARRLEAAGGFRISDPAGADQESAVFLERFRPNRHGCAVQGEIRALRGHGKIYALWRERGSPRCKSRPLFGRE